MTEQERILIKNLEQKIEQNTMLVANRLKNQSEILRRLQLIEDAYSHLVKTNSNLATAHQGAIDYIQLPWHKKIFRSKQ